MEQDPDEQSSDAKRSPPLPQSTNARPHYVTVGPGSVSASASALIAQLDHDSGYGGSIAGDSTMLPAWDPRNTHDSTPGSQHGLSSPDHDRSILDAHIHQLHYNQNRTALARAITHTVDILTELQRQNGEWPAHYPSLHQTEEPPGHRPSSRPGLPHSQTTLRESAQTEGSVARPQPPRRAETSLGEASTAESSKTGEVSNPEPAPALITPQAAREFSILKLDLKLQGLTQSEIAHSMDRRSIASLLDRRINDSVRHLQLLRDRIEDTSSKVLVTGDLNAGKSTFCNALLRRKVLPEDQQPCTAIFCEVLDARENGGVEEVHAVRVGTVYDRNDERTYEVFSLKELDTVVEDNEHYAQCKIYVKDIRTIDESLLNNGVVDISIIDAPGLNADSLQTTAVFARQEEIDVVVFVVEAENHFTLSAKEFIWNAAREKAYIFIVVNGYDKIKKKERLQRMILDQVQTLSPRTFKESSELVHFVASNQIPVAPLMPGGPPGGGGGGGGGSGASSGPSDDPPHDDDEEGLKKDGSPGLNPEKGKGKEKENREDFDHLERALRRFVLEKRARSKLAPARTYLMNVLSDLHYLAESNQRIAEEEAERVRKELEELVPACERSERATSEVSEQAEQTIEAAQREIYDKTRAILNSVIERVADQDLGVEYPGLISAFQYAEDLKAAILSQIADTVSKCEDAARQRATSGVREIVELGRPHLGDEFANISFRSDRLFRSRRHDTARDVNPSVELWDFFDVGGVFERQEKVAGGGMALTVVGVLGGRLVGGVGWLDGVLGAARVLGAQNVRRMIVPGLVATVCLAAAYVLRSIPQTLPKRLSRRIAADLAEADYTHTNSLRISSEVGKVLRFPAYNLRVGLQQSVESLQKQRQEKSKTQKESELARKYFANLFRDSAKERRVVEALDLEGSAAPPSEGTGLAIEGSSRL